MADKQLRAVVIGAGWAGEGHTRALQTCGVNVVALCARQSSAVEPVAARLGVPLASTDWRHTLTTVRPDIVALTTPAALRGEVVELAAGLGCHILCEKPLATTAAEAKRLYRIAEQAGVKHAYAATHRYDPGVDWLVELIRSGAIGRLREIHFILYREFGGGWTPWTWWDTLATGGGALNAGLTHCLGILETVIGGPVTKATGEARVQRRRAPVVPELHDYRRRAELAPTELEAANLEWRDCDADDAFSALLQFAPGISAQPGEETPEVQVCMLVNFRAGGNGPADGWYLYGDKGMLVAEGVRTYTVFRHNPATGQREPLPIPQRLIDARPQESNGDDVQEHWTSLSLDFVGDIRGEPVPPYLTFREGWRYQEAIDAIRSGRGWYTIPA
jgi:predicted dehydrogenase